MHRHIEYINYVFGPCPVGLYQLPVAQLIDPPRESRLLRETDEKFVKNLKLKMILDPSAPGATPLAVLCKDVSLSTFHEKHLNVYRYEVLGGLHSFHAKLELMKEFPNNPFYQEALAEVYLELSDEQALRLAQRHNANSHFVHRITHRDLVRLVLSCQFDMHNMHTCIYMRIILLLHAGICKAISSWCMQFKGICNLHIHAGEKFHA